MDATPLPLNSEFLCRMTLSAGAPAMVGPTRHGELRVIAVTGGTLEGPRLKGEVVGGTSGDWLRVEPDGTAHMDVRLTVKAAGGGVVFVHYTGVRTGAPEVLQRLNAGEAVDPSDYYFRIAVRFETGEPSLAWLNRVLAVGVGQRPPGGPVYDLYAIR